MSNYTSNTENSRSLNSDNKASSYNSGPQSVSHSAPGANLGHDNHNYYGRVSNPYNNYYIPPEYQNDSTNNTNSTTPTKNETSTSPSYEKYPPYPHMSSGSHYPYYNQSYNPYMNMPPQYGYAPMHSNPPPNMPPHNPPPSTNTSASSSTPTTASDKPVEAPVEAPVESTTTNQNSSTDEGSPNFIGKTLTFITNSQCRYVGVLCDVNHAEMKISLKNVRSYGTENRTSPTGEVYPASNDTYSLLVFNSQDIASVTLYEEQPHNDLQDPAIVSAQRAEPNENNYNNRRNNYQQNNRNPSNKYNNRRHHMPDSNITFQQDSVQDPSTFDFSVGNKKFENISNEDDSVKMTYEKVYDKEKSFFDDLSLPVHRSRNNNKNNRRTNNYNQRSNDHNPNNRRNNNNNNNNNNNRHNNRRPYKPVFNQFEEKQQ